MNKVKLKSAIKRHFFIGYVIAGINIAGVILMQSVYASEWKIEPTIVLKALYDDNVRMYSDANLQQSSTAYTLEPMIKFAANELKLWDMSVDARGRMTRYQDVEDVDSDNLFYGFNGGRQTELTEWRLAASYERNSNFDTDFETQTPDSGYLLDDRTDRKSIAVSPSVRWNTSETSLIQFSLTSNDISFDEVINLDYKNYDYDSVQFVAKWFIGENHQLGFTSSYAEYDSPDANYSYDQSILQLNYIYNINQTSGINLSVGARRIDSLIVDGQIIACGNPGEFEALGGCLFSAPVFGDLTGKDEGTVTNMSYTRQTETTSQILTAGRTVIPSSFGSAQEQRIASYQFNINSTERLSLSLILDASKTETISGIYTLNDRVRYRIEPSVNYKLSRNWSLGFQYRYIKQNITISDNDSESNTVYVSLRMHWPKLITTY